MMVKFIIRFITVVSIFSLLGCIDVTIKSSVSKNPDAEEVLQLDKDANIFQWDDLIYQTDIEWVNDLKLTKKEPVGEITELYTEEGTKSFKHGMANKLPIGTKIYSTNENGILIADYNDKEMYYLALVEG